ncbi:MAG: metallophosphoesterase [Clostridiales bacterium]|nr:metallophosphoesterase [Clostridiales bacterium]
MLYIIIVLFIISIVLFVWGLLASRELVVRNYTIEYANLPAIFDGYKIIQITDYHNGIYQNDNEVLVNKISEQDPDIILMTGDMIDRKSSEIENIVSLCEELKDTAPIIWVKGNNYYKADPQLAEELSRTLNDMGIIVLSNNCYNIEKETEHISFCGLDDPEQLYSSQELPTEYTKKATQKIIERNIETLKEESNNIGGFKILVSHRFTQYELFPEYGYSLAIAGHSHGGQVKLPFGVEFIGYDFKLFPQIKTGYNNIDGMPLIISSGLGTSNIDIRLFNPPEIVVIELKLKQ